MKYDKEWYNSLAKPKFQPPEWVFAPVWMVLYVMMGVALVLVLLSPFKWTNVLAYPLFFLQIVVNLQWTPVFFEDHNLRGAFLLSAILTVLVFATMVLFFIASKLAGLLLLPYFLWCIFASVLSFEILERNEW